MKILYVIDKMVRAGAQRHLVEAISGLDRKEFEPFACCLLYRGPLADELEKNGVKVEALELENIIGDRFFKAVGGLRRLIRLHNIDVVHSYLFAANVVSPWAAFISGIPAITSRRDTGFWKGPRHIVAHRLANIVTDRITANSLAVADYLRRRERVREKKIVLVRNGIALPADRPAPSSGYRPGKPFILGCLGNIRPVKGYEYLLSALNILREKSVPFELHLGGRILDQAYYEKLNAIVGEYHLEGAVHFRGEIDDVDTFLRQLHVFALPSLSEGFSNSLLEAMREGLPVVATDVGGNGEVIDDGVSGFIVPPADASSLASRLNDLFRDERLRAAMGKEARERIRRDFGVEKMCSELGSLYRSIMEEV